MIQVNAEEVRQLLRCSGTCDGKCDNEKVHCPVHDPDKINSPTLSVNAGDKVDVLYACWENECRYEDIQDAVDDLLMMSFSTNGGAPKKRPRQKRTKPNDIGSPLSYALLDAKGLSAEFIEDEGFDWRDTEWRDKETGDTRHVVEMPYRNESGKVVATRVRLEVKGAKRFVWRKRPKIVPYGLHLLKPEHTRVLLVEGETDTLALLQAGIPALGIPGADNWKSEWARHLRGRLVYVWQEPDTGGATFARKIFGDLPDARVIKAPDGAKDANELWLGCEGDADTFREVMDVLFEKATVTEQTRSPLDLLIRLKDIEPAQPQWLWESRLLRGGLTLLNGPPGVGKSYLTLKIAATVARAEPFPLDNYEPRLPGDVFLLSAEDNVKITVRPRLDEFGADVEHISIVPDDHVHTLDDLIAFVDGTINETGRNYKLLVIDTINSFLPGVDTHKDASVRVALKRLRATVERWNIACLMVTHPTKDSRGKDLWQQAQGSVAFVGLPRVVLACVEVERKDPLDGTTELERALVQVKCNLGRPAESVGYELSDVPEVFRWTGRSSITKEHFSAKSPARSRLDEMDEWLRTLLSDGPVLSSEVLDLAAERGWTEDQIEGAKRRIGARSQKRALREGWEWCLPEDYDE